MRALIPVYVKMQNRLHNEEGATMVEYALMVALIAAVVATAVSGLATSLSNEFTAIAGLLK